MTKSAAQLLMERETRVRYGPIDLDMFGYKVARGQSHLEDDRFLLHTPDGLSYFYRKGDGITISRDAAADVSEEQLWLKGSVYSAVACINGFMPIHASAVAYQDRVFAFTGPGGAGKSTLITLLGQLGLPMFCDDTLVLDLSDDDTIRCLPGHKRLKLTPEAIALTGVTPEERVGSEYDKHYAAPPGGTIQSPLPLAELIFLERGETLSIEPLRGSERFVRTQDDGRKSSALTGTTAAGMLTGTFGCLAAAPISWRRSIAWQAIPAWRPCSIFRDCERRWRTGPQRPKLTPSISLRASSRFRAACWSRGSSIMSKAETSREP